MPTTVEFIPGPLTGEVSRERADEGLRQHPAIQKGAAYSLEQLEGRWVAAVVHEAAPPFGAPAPGGPPGGGPADAEEEAPGPKSEGPDDQEPSADDGPPSPDDGGGEDSDGPPKDEKGKGGEKAELHQVLDALHQIAEALGVPLGMGADSMVPGPDDAGAPPPPPGPPGPPGLHGGPAEQHVVHERVTKPGETPPGGTPIGAPAFASVREDHPWGHVAGKVASFKVAEQIGDMPINEVEKELTSLASEIGYHWKNLREATDQQGNRIAEAVITKH